MLGQQLPQKRFKLIFNPIYVVDVSMTEEADGEDGHQPQAVIVITSHRV